MDESKLQMLLDKAEISDVQLRYATGLDTRNWALFQTCFTDEFDADFTSVFGGTARRVSAAKWAESARRTLSGLAATPAHHHQPRHHRRRRQGTLRRVRAGAALSSERSGR